VKKRRKKTKIMSSDNKFKVKIEKVRETYTGLNLITAYIWDASKQFLPESTPGWLWNVLDIIKKNSGGYCGRLEESVFEIDDTFYNALITNKRCESHEEIETPGMNT
jgi:hypothetical protein